MKRAKRLTRKQRSEAQKTFLALLAQLPKKPVKVKPVFSLKTYLANKAKKRLEKLTWRQEKREAKLHAGHKH